MHSASSRLRSGSCTLLSAIQPCVLALAWISLGTGRTLRLVAPLGQGEIRVLAVQ